MYLEYCIKYCACGNAASKMRNNRMHAHCLPTCLGAVSCICSAVQNTCRCYTAVSWGLHGASMHIGPVAFVSMQHIAIYNIACCCVCKLFLTSHFATRVSQQDKKCFTNVVSWVRETYINEMRTYSRQLWQTWQICQVMLPPWTWTAQSNATLTEPIKA